MRAPEVGTSQAANPPNQPKCFCASSGGTLGDRHAGEPRDRGRDLPERDAFVADRVERPARCAAFDRQAKDAGRVEAMDSRPAIEFPRRHRPRRLFRARGRREWERSPSPEPVHGRRQAHGRGAEPPRGERNGGVFRSAGIGVGNRNGGIVFRRDRASGMNCDAGGHEQGPFGTRERGAEGFDGLPVDFAVPLEIGEVVDKPEMDHGVGRRRAALEAFEVLEGAALDLRACRDHPVRRRVRARETEDRMPRADQVGDDGRADESAGASNKYSHGKRLRGWTSRTIGCYTIRVNT